MTHSLDLVWCGYAAAGTRSGRMLLWWWQCSHQIGATLLHSMALLLEWPSKCKLKGDCPTGIALQAVSRLHCQVHMHADTHCNLPLPLHELEVLHTYVSMRVCIHVGACVCRRMYR